MLDGVSPVLIFLLVVIPAISYATVTPHLPIRNPNACSQKAIDNDPTGLIAKAKTLGVLSCVVCSTLIGFILLLITITNPLSPVTFFGVVYIAVLILLVKRFIKVWKSDKPKYQLIEAMEENSILTKFSIMFIAVGPIVVPVAWSFLFILLRMSTLGSP